MKRKEEIYSPKADWVFFVWMPALGELAGYDEVSLSDRLCWACSSEQLVKVSGAEFYIVTSLMPQPCTFKECSKGLFPVFCIGGRHLLLRIRGITSLNALDIGHHISRTKVARVDLEVVHCRPDPALTTSAWEGTAYPA